MLGLGLGLNNSILCSVSVAAILAAASSLALDLDFVNATINPDGSPNAGEVSLTYTGASHKRQWNADGVLEYAPHNLNYKSVMVGYSVTSPTVMTNNYSDIAAPDGTLTATRISDGSQSVTIGNVTPSSPNTKGIWARATSAGGTVALLGYYNFAKYQFTLTTEWQYFEAPGDITETGGVSFYLADFRFGTCKDILVWHPSCCLTPVARKTEYGFDTISYIETTGTPVYAARAGERNRKPVTNLLTYPEQFDNAAWTNSNTSESGTQADPFGGTNAFKLVESNTAAGSTHYIEATTGIAVQAKVYTHSVYAKAGERTWLRLGFATAAGVAFFNLSTGAVGTTSGLDGYGIAPVEGQAGWYRCWITDTLAAGTDKPRITLAEADNDVAYDGDGSSGLYIFGAMLNEGGIEDYVGATNLLIGDKTIGGTGWTTSTLTVTADAAVAPDGTTTADNIAATGTNGVAFQNRTTTAGAHTLTLFVRKGTTGNTIRMDLRDIVTNWAYSFNLDTESITQIATAATVVDMEYVGGGYYRLRITATLNTTTGQAFVYVPTSGDDFNVWGFQLTKGSTLYPYVGMPQTGFVKVGYTAEAAATNLVTDSEDFSAASWTASSTTGARVVDAIGPDGLTSATILIDNAATGTGAVNIQDNFTVSTSTSYVFSFFAKADQLGWAKLRIGLFTTPSGFPSAFFDLLGGKVGTVQTGYSGTGIIPCGNGWYRCWASFTTDVSDTSGEIKIYVAEADNDDTVDLDGTSSILIYGAQFETGTYPSSYIKTSGGTATRAADRLIDNDMSWYPANGEYTLVAEHIPFLPVSGSPSIVDIGDNENSRSNLYFRTNGVRQLDVRNASGSTIAALTTATGFINSGVRTRHATRIKTDDMNVADNGTTVTADTSGTVGTTADQMHIGASYNAGAAHTSHTRLVQIHVPPKSDADLATLSTITDDGTSWRLEQEVA